jgi:tRNA-specific 2-thiouridylase
MGNDVTNKRIILGLSGGVDSAVAALLLQEAGADVQALHMTNWEDDDGYCSAAADLQDARSICQQLDIPLHLKFGEFRRYAKRLGGEMLATGHYARTAVIDGRVALLKGVDKGKDQSYFLHAVPAGALAETVFPLGTLEKGDIRRIAREHGLSVHDKKDSTGICFIGERPFREFLSTYLPANPGPIESADGAVLGEHHGLMYYTIGQRQGLGVGGLRGSSGQPWYVVSKDTTRNALIVDQGDTHLLMSCGLIAKEPAWVGQAPPRLDRGFECTAKIRYRQEDQRCQVTTTGGGTLEVRFQDPQRAVAPGQFVVFYADQQCLGGAIIDQLLPLDEPAAARRSA